MTKFFTFSIILMWAVFPAIAEPPGMVLIPAGEVAIGLSQAQLDLHNREHRISPSLADYTRPNGWALSYQTVYVDAFYMDTHEVTWRKYVAFTKESGYRCDRVERILSLWSQEQIDSIQDEPIVQLTMADMEAYAAFYGKAIPTEIEWEKAARGGRADTTYPWGNTIDPSHCNYNSQGLLNAIGSGGNFILRLVDVGQYPPNGYGLYDMMGNASEFVDSEYNRRGNGVDTVVHRGGNCRSDAYEMPVWFRQQHATGSGWGTTGFRCVKRIGAITGDLNSDGIVNVLDLVLIANAMGETGNPADINSDGIVNVLDLVAVANAITLFN